MSWIDQLDKAARIVASWPEWKREMLRRQVGWREPLSLAEIRERLLSDPEVRAAYEAMDEEEE